MISLKQILTGSAVAALVGVGVMASTGSASAYVVCNNAGDCWHTDTRYKYNRDVGATYHNDNWYFHQKWRRPATVIIATITKAAAAIATVSGSPSNPGLNNEYKTPLAQASGVLSFRVDV